MLIINVNHLSLPVLPLIMNMTRTQEGNVFQAIIFAMVTMIAKMVQMNNMTCVVSVKTFGISTVMPLAGGQGGL